MVNTIVMGGTKIGEGCVLQANSCLMKGEEAMCDTTYAGIPLVSIKNRSKVGRIATATNATKVSNNGESECPLESKVLSLARKMFRCPGAMADTKIKSISDSVTATKFVNAVQKLHGTVINGEPIDTSSVNITALFTHADNVRLLACLIKAESESNETSDTVNETSDTSNDTSDSDSVAPHAKEGEDIP